jgi:hypothetical protein
MRLFDCQHIPAVALIDDGLAWQTTCRDGGANYRSGGSCELAGRQGRHLSAGRKEGRVFNPFKELP